MTIQRSDFCRSPVSLLKKSTSHELLPLLRNRHGIDVDPVYTLVERLLLLGDLIRADKVSKHYMYLLDQTEVR